MKTTLQAPDCTENLRLSRRTTLGLLGLGIATVACASESGDASNGSGGTSLGGAGDGTGGAQAAGGGATSTGGTHVGGADTGVSCDLYGGWAQGGTSCMTDVASYPNPFTKAATSCPTKPDVTIGPCHTTSPERVDISDGLEGIPMRCALRVVDSDCNPISGAIVEVWHTNYKGGYSGDISQMCTLEEEDKQAHFFRGFQVSDEDGIVYFNSCFPGWYSSRAVHVHVRVLIGEYNSNDAAPSAAITQLLWDDDLVDSIFQEVPLYARFGTPDTHLDDDNVVGSVSDKNAFVFDVEQMSDGAMLCSKTIVVSV